MPFVKVNIHFVWSTKNRIQFLHTKELRKLVWNHIRKNALKKGIHIDFINGYSDHCHCLISLGQDQSIKNIMHFIKGESSNWINNQGLINQNFEWQDDYFAVSVSESIINTVRNYIKNQEEHHSKITYQQEYDAFILKYGFQKYND